MFSNIFLLEITLSVSIFSYLSAFLRIDFQKRYDKDKEYKHFKAFHVCCQIIFSSGGGGGGAAVCVSVCEGRRVVMMRGMVNIC